MKVFKQVFGTHWLANQLMARYDRLSSSKHNYQLKLAFLAWHACVRNYDLLIYIPSNEMNTLIVNVCCF